MDTHNLCVLCKGHTERNERGQSWSEGRVREGAVHPSKMSNSGSLAEGVFFFFWREGRGAVTFLGPGTLKL